MAVSDGRIKRGSPGPGPDRAGDDRRTKFGESLRRGPALRGCFGWLRSTVPRALVGLFRMAVGARGGVLAVARTHSCVRGLGGPRSFPGPAGLFRMAAFGGSPGPAGLFRMAARFPGPRRGCFGWPHRLSPGPGPRRVGSLCCVVCPRHAAPPRTRRVPRLQVGLAPRVAISGSSSSPFLWSCMPRSTSSGRPRAQERRLRTAVTTTPPGHHAHAHATAHTPVQAGASRIPAARGRRVTFLFAH